MKLATTIIAGMVLVLFAGSARAESRTVLIRIKPDKDQKPLVTIYSDAKTEQKSSISVEEAIKVIAVMKGWGSSVGVYIWTESRLPGDARGKLFKAIDDNVWLVLEYFGRQSPKTIADYFIKDEPKTTKPEPSPAPKEVGIYEKVHKRAELPAPGEVVNSPKGKDIVYYFANTRRMWGEPGNVGKHAGLYASKDGAKTWRLITTSYEFEKLFIHPDTNQLFAIITYDWLATGEKDGLLHHYYSNKIITSADGAKWKDITGGRGYITELLSIFADPDHPGRVCLEASGIRGYVLQSKDERYSDWNWLRQDRADGKRLLDTIARPKP
jgi:hypothetical protein